MHDACLSEQPFVDTERDEESNANYQRRQCLNSFPCKNASAKIKPSQKKSEAGGKEGKTWKVESPDLLHKR
jgi:hypothetical protein